MKHYVLIRREKGVGSRPAFFIRNLLRRAIICALKAENVNVPCEINVLLTDDEGIRAVNRDMRKVDKPTDVLSFPMFGFVPGAFDPADGATDPQTGRLPLGDMVISLERVSSQAREYGHSQKRERSIWLCTVCCIFSVMTILMKAATRELCEPGKRRL